MIRLGLMGGIAAGKSEVARMLARRGATVLDADRLAHEAYEPGTPGFERLLHAFGPEIVGTDGHIDRSRLGALVFGDASMLKRLTDIVWPLTRALAEERMRQAAERGARVVVLEAPLLIEAGWRDLVDEVWFVRSPLPLVRERLRRRGLDAAAIEARLSARDRLDEAARAANRVIDNDADLETLEARVEECWQALLAKDPGSADGR